MGFITEDCKVCYLSGEINRTKTEQILEWLLRLKGKKGTLIINSGGGDEAQGFAIYDLITNYGSEKIEALVVGECHSSAIPPLLACGRRAATWNASFMIHHGEIIDGGGVHTKEYLQQAKHIEQSDYLYSTIIAETTKLSGKRLSEKMQFGWYFGCFDAVKQGFIAEVAEDFTSIFASKSQSARRKVRHG